MDLLLPAVVSLRLGRMTHSVPALADRALDNLVLGDHLPHSGMATLACDGMREKEPRAEDHHSRIQPACPPSCPMRAWKRAHCKPLLREAGSPRVPPPASCFIFETVRPRDLMTPNLRLLSLIFFCCTVLPAPGQNGAAQGGVRKFALSAAALRRW